MPVITRPRLRKAARLAVVPVAITVSAITISSASYSAFSATTSNSPNSWSTGSVTLADDDSGAAMFTATALRPGSTDTKCIKVTSTGTLPATVKLYGTGYSAGGTLAANITLSVSQGTGGSFGSCTGFSGTSIYSGTLAGFSAKTDFSSGAGTWAPTGAPPENQVYQFTYTVGSSAPQGQTASIGFTWEAQSS